MAKADPHPWRCIHSRATRRGRRDVNKLKSLYIATFASPKDQQHKDLQDFASHLHWARLQVSVGSSQRSSLEHRARQQLTGNATVCWSQSLLTYIEVENLIRRRLCKFRDGDSASNWRRFTCLTEFRPPTSLWHCYLPRGKRREPHPPEPPLWVFVFLVAQRDAPAFAHATSQGTCSGPIVAKYQNFKCGPQ